MHYFISSASVTTNLKALGVSVLIVERNSTNLAIARSQTLVLVTKHLLSPNLKYTLVGPSIIWLSKNTFQFFKCYHQENVNMKWHFNLCVLFFAQLATRCSSAANWGAIEDRVEHFLNKREASPRHRHRHRHRHYQQHHVTDMDSYNVDEIVKGKHWNRGLFLEKYWENVFSKIFNAFSKSPVAFEKELNTLTDGLTIKEDVAEMAKNNVTFPKTEDLGATLRSQKHVCVQRSMNCPQTNLIFFKYLPATNWNTSQ